MEALNFSWAFLRNSKKLARLQHRRARISDERVVAFFASEALFQVGLALNKSLRLDPNEHSKPVTAAMKLYGRSAAKVLAQQDQACLYHYRAGFGLSSVPVARSQGMFTLCDHSIAHPSSMRELVAGGGKMPSGSGEASDPFWRLVLHDIEQADAVVVNSDFVRETFAAQGFDPSLIHVVHWGVDEEFIPYLTPRRSDTEGPLRLLFAGTFEPRKGALVLLEALDIIKDLPWQLQLAGQCFLPLRRRLKDNPKVSFLGNITRPQLAKRMAEAEVFVFPSLAEGSARVVFEALASGCYVVTTPNSGSIVRDGVHGALIAPGQTDALVGAIRWAIKNRSALARIGDHNAKVVQTRFRQTHYGEALVSLYARLLDGSREEL